MEKKKDRKEYQKPEVQIIELEIRENISSVDISTESPGDDMEIEGNG